MIVSSLLAYLFVCHYFGHQLFAVLPEENRLVIRTVFYALTIVAFPITNLIRYVQLRLNQTMPGNQSAKNRYLVTVIVSMILIESVGLMGLIIFMLGDDYNTLYIFTGLSVLGVYLYRPKQEEYSQIVRAMAERNEKR